MNYLYFLLICVIFGQVESSFATVSVIFENLTCETVTTPLTAQQFKDSPYEALYSSSQHLLKIHGNRENCLTIRKETHDDNVVIKIEKHPDNLPFMEEKEFLEIARKYDVSRRHNVKNKFANMLGLASPRSEQRNFIRELLPETVPIYKMSACCHLGGFSLDEISADKVMHMIPQEACLFEFNNYTSHNSVIYFCHNKASIYCIPRLKDLKTARNDSERNLQFMKDWKWHQYVVNKEKLKDNGAIDTIKLSLAETGTGIGALEGNIKFGKDKDKNFELKLQNISVELMLSKEYEIRF